MLLFSKDNTFLYVRLKVESCVSSYLRRNVDLTNTGSQILSYTLYSLTARCFNYQNRKYHIRVIPVLFALDPHTDTINSH